MKICPEDEFPNGVLKYQVPCPRELNLGQRAPSSLPVAWSRQPHRRNTKP